MPPPVRSRRRKTSTCGLAPFWLNQEEPRTFVGSHRREADLIFLQDFRREPQMLYVWAVMQRAQIIEHVGKRIVFIDLSHAKVADISAAFGIAKPLIRSQPANSVLTLTNATGITIADAGNAQISMFLKTNKPFVKASAVYGATDLAKAILSTMRIITGRQVAAFDTREAAIRWLVSHE